MCCQKAKQENWQQHTKTVCTKNISEIWYHDLESKVFLRLQVFHVCQTVIQWPNYQGQGRKQPDLCCLSWPQWFLWTLTSQCWEKFWIFIWLIYFGPSHFQSFDTSILFLPIRDAKFGILYNNLVKYYKPPACPAWWYNMGKFIALLSQILPPVILYFLWWINSSFPYRCNFLFEKQIFKIYTICNLKVLQGVFSAPLPEDKIAGFLSGRHSRHKFT